MKDVFKSSSAVPKQPSDQVVSLVRQNGQLFEQLLHFLPTHYCMSLCFGGSFKLEFGHERDTMDKLGPYSDMTQFCFEVVFGQSLC